MKSQLFVKPNNWLLITCLTIGTMATGAVGTYSIWRYQSLKTTSPVVVSTTPRKLKAVAALGYVEPAGEAIKISAPAFMEGSRLDKLLVKQGDQVEAGQVLAILDSRNRLQAALKQAQDQVRIAQSLLAQVKAGAKQGDIIAQNARFQGTRSELEGQITTQKATIASLTAQLQGEKMAQYATIERLKAEFHNAQKDCQRYNTLYQEGAVSDQERNRFCLIAQTSQESLREANANLNRIVTTLSAKIDEAEANLQRTVATLDQKIKENQATLDAVAEVRPVDVEVAQSQLIAAQSAVQKAKADLDLAFVKAPKAGQILKIYTWPGELIGDKGILDLGQTSQMYVTSEVYETDVSRVKLGQRAKITTDGLIGELRGTVAEIGLQIGKKDVLGTDPVADADARVVEVKIRLDPSSSKNVANLTNLQVNVVIDTNKTNL
ncbi:MAG: biotin/lipoyl-binding protein [Microcystis aeruginosa Ma_MB_S_20031200_S102]|uniref:Biotin/lipoyl-binding protein n=1 Tax=Microcystis aeruginosa Ma_MB_S_20031200_S102 TaxID=2486254 RepID=A0A552F056_MICAE|nr:MAG: biotin/lipoyl-binding protein [Microcystis aeruginosa Ma_MB_S_20031200_S102D]TRU40092.1 MAG: biotin/lipoyl-binding protein [Microcystis aeruginosa Ma_MB_S_20031200_S102]